jgi:hypothetical protein
MSPSAYNRPVARDGVASIAHREKGLNLPMAKAGGSEGCIWELCTILASWATTSVAAFPGQLSLSAAIRAGALARSAAAPTLLQIGCPLSR